MSRNVLALPVPSTPQLTSSIDAAIRQAITSHAGETHHPDAFASDIASLTDLRSHVGHMEDHGASLENAYKYYAQLVFVATKLPSILPISFPWAQPLVSTSLLAFGSSAASIFHDSSAEAPSEAASTFRRSEEFAIVYDGTVFVGHPSLQWEKANALFATACLLSSLGAQESRSDGNSIKRAVGYFQTSSAILSHLETVVIPSFISNLTPTSPSHGLHPAAIRPLATLNLAQAQECFWQKAASDGMKSGTVAKLAKAVEDLYEQTIEEIKKAEIEDGIEPVPKTWLNHITVKRHHFAAASQFRKSQEDLSNSRYGDEISRLQIAETHVKSALAALKKGLPSSTSTEAVSDDIKGLQGVIESNLKRGRKDNDLIYLEPVTPANSLAAIQAARMVQAKLPVEVSKPIECLRPIGSASANDGLASLGKPLFGALVPYGAHLAISIYEDRKDTWWRENIEGKRQEMEALVSSSMESLGLPGAVDALDRSDSSDPGALPATLTVQIQGIQREGGVGRINALRDEVQRMATVNSDALGQAKQLLDAEAQQDAALRTHYTGSNYWVRQESSVASRNYWKRYEELAGTLHMAGDSDQVVRSKIDKWTQSWSILDEGQAAIIEELPTRAASLVDVEGDGTAVTSSSPIVKDLRRNFEAINGLLEEVAAMSAESRSLVRSDDIRDKVMREVARLSTQQSGEHAGDDSGALDLGPELFETLFELEFGKYRAIEGQITGFEKKLSALLEKLQAQSASFTKQMRSNSSLAAQRNSILSNLDLASSKYFEALSNLSEGLKFYNSLAPMCSELQMQAAEWKKSRETDVEELISSFQRTNLATEAPHPPKQTQEETFSTPGRRTTRSQAKKGTPAGKNVPPPTAAPAGIADEDEEEVLAALGGSGVGGSAAASGSNGQPGPASGEPSQWGAWSGGKIQFGD